MTTFNIQETYNKRLEELQELVNQYNKLNGEVQGASRKLQEIALEIARKEAIVQELDPFVEKPKTEVAKEDDSDFKDAIPV